MAAADGADGNCYEAFNTAGQFNGHCGLNGTSGAYLRCAAEYVIRFSVHPSGHCRESVMKCLLPLFVRDKFGTKQTHKMALKSRFT